MGITYHDQAMIYTVDELPGKKFKSRSAAENALTRFDEKRIGSLCVVMSFSVDSAMQSRLKQMAREKGITTSKMIRDFVQKGMSDYEEERHG